MLNNSYYGKKILITGGSGFIGSLLATSLSSQHARVCIIDRKKIHNPGYTTYIGDIGNPHFVKTAVQSIEPDYIFHLAATKERSSRLPDFSSYIDENVKGSLNLFSSLMTADIQGLVYLSTAEEYGHNKCPFSEEMSESPVSAYSYSKMCVTKMCTTFHQLYNFPAIVLRGTLAYGPGQHDDMFLPTLISTLSAEKEFAMSPGEQTRDFIHVNDLVDALILAAQNSHRIAGQVINIGSGIPLQLKDIALKVQSMMHKKDLIRLGKLEYRKGEIMDYYVDISKAHRLLGWEPSISFEDGLADMIKALKNE